MKAPGNTLVIALSVGLASGIYFALWTLFSYFTGYAMDFMKSFEGFGYSVTPIGAIVGFIFAFLDGTIFTAIVVSFYKLLSETSINECCTKE